MGRRNSAAVKNVWVLFATATFLLSASWLMRSFPLLIFIGLAPLFAISDIAKDKESPWNHLEVILLSLGVSLFCATLFNTADLVAVFAQSILLTLSFGGYAFAYQNLGTRLGKFTIVFFWLGLEYLMLKLPWRGEFHFLADALELKTDWWRWNREMGYLSISIWILIVNLVFYLGLYKYSTFNWFFIGLGIFFTAAPIIYSVFFIEDAGINSAQMLALYDGGIYEPDSDYAKRGEWITRTSAWISVLILLLALVNYKIKKK